MIYGSLFKQTPNLSFFMDGRGKGKVEFERRKELWLQKMGEGSASPGTLPKFVFPVLGTVPFRWSAERFQQNSTSKQNSDQPAEYTNQLYIIFFPSSLFYLFYIT
jgi:hypothetical protein